MRTCAAQDNVNPCWKYARGKCDIKDEKCWFLHKCLNGSKFECTSWDNMFAVQDKLLHLRKQKHGDSVKSCRNFISGACKYGSEKCWFNLSDCVNTTKTERRINKILMKKLQNKYFKCCKNLHNKYWK